jgi:hypothetical protein
MIVSNDLHHWFFKDISAVDKYYFVAVSTKPAFLHWLYAAYNTVLIIIANLF